MTMKSLKLISIVFSFTVALACGEKKEEKTTTIVQPAPEAAKTNESNAETAGTPVDQQSQPAPEQTTKVASNDTNRSNTETDESTGGGLSDDKIQQFMGNVQLILQVLKQYGASHLSNKPETMKQIELAEQFVFENLPKLLGAETITVELIEPMVQQVLDEAKKQGTEFGELDSGSVATKLAMVLNIMRPSIHNGNIGPTSILTMITSFLGVGKEFDLEGIKSVIGGLSLTNSTGSVPNPL